MALKPVYGLLGDIAETSSPHTVVRKASPSLEEYLGMQLYRKMKDMELADSGETSTIIKDELDTHSGKMAVIMHTRYGQIQGSLFRRHVATDEIGIRPTISFRNLEKRKHQRILV